MLHALVAVFLAIYPAFAEVIKLVPIEGASFGLDRCYVHPDLGSKLERLAPLLAEKKLKLVLWDCYRLLDVQKAMWKIVPDARYVADPKVGSNHNRGIAVDVSLAGGKGPLPKR